MEIDIQSQPEESGIPEGAVTLDPPVLVNAAVIAASPTVTWFRWCYDETDPPQHIVDLSCGMRIGVPQITGSDVDAAVRSELTRNS